MYEVLKELIKLSFVNPKEIKMLHVFRTTAAMLLSWDVLPLCL